MKPEQLTLPWAFATWPPASATWLLLIVSFSVTSYFSNCINSLG